MRWCLLTEEFLPELHYIKGGHNVAADTLSRLEISQMFSNYQTTSMTDNAEAFGLDALPSTAYPLAYSTIQKYQQDNP